MNFKNYTANSNATAKATTTKNDQVNTIAAEETEKSIVDLSYSHKTTFNAGNLIPIYYSECYPGDHFNIDVSTLIKMSIPSAPTMDAPRYDINFFFVPWKQVFPNWNEVIGQEYSGGAPVEEATVPAITFDASDFKYGVNDLASYFNIPINVNMNNAGININALPFRAYIKIWNEWYRDENLQAEEDYSNDNNINSASVSVSALENAGLTQQIGLGTLQVNRLRDYFASCLPFIQKGTIPTIATLNEQEINNILSNTEVNSIPIQNGSGNYFNPNITDENGNSLYDSAQNNNWFLTMQNNDSNLQAANFGTQSFNQTATAYMSLETQQINSLGNMSNYSGSGAGTFNITDLRNALVKQHQQELDARAGTRYYEKLLSYWGVELNPLEIGRTEYIGGWHNNLNINNIVQTSPNNSTANTPLGTLGGLSITTDANKNTVDYSCNQYGIIIGLICVRTNITYSQGLPKIFTKLQNTDFYNPTFNGISEQPIYAYELYLDGSLTTSNANNMQVFGFNQPFADLKYTVNRASGYVSANAIDTYYNFYTYQNVLNQTPTLSNSWMYYPAEALENTLLLDSSNKMELVNDFLADFYFNVQCSRNIPAYSVPGVNKI